MSAAAPNEPSSLPPSLSEDVQDVQAMQVATFDRAQAILATLPAAQRAAFEMATNLMQVVLAQLSRHSEPAEGNEGIGPARLEAFALLLQQRRRVARMSRERLALRAGLSPSTIKNLEHAKQSPTRTTLCRLLAVPELGLKVLDIAEDVAAHSAWQANAWLAPRYDAAALFGEMVQMLSSPAELSSRPIFTSSRRAPPTGWISAAASASTRPGAAPVPSTRSPHASRALALRRGSMWWGSEPETAKTRRGLYRPLRSTRARRHSA